MSSADAVVVVIEREDGRVLGVSRPGLPGDLGLPGGSIDAGETPEAAAIREVKEETTLVVEVRRVDTRPYHGHTVFSFVATRVEGTPRSSAEGDVRWASWDEVCRGRYGDFNEVLRELTRGAGA